MDSEKNQRSTTGAGITDHPLTAQQQQEGSVTRALAIKECVRLASRLHSHRTQCLPRSIVLRQMLNRMGMSARVVIGVHKSHATLASHAWVEIVAGRQWQPLGEPESLSVDFTVV